MHTWFPAVFPLTDVYCNADKAKVPTQSSLSPVAFNHTSEAYSKGSFH